MPFNLRGPEILILVLIILLLFGAKRLPDVARGLGRSLRIFKAETKDLQGAGDEGADSADHPRPAAVEGSAPAAIPPTTPVDGADPAPAKPQAERAES